MLTYQYTARNTATGQKVTSEIQADSETAAAKLLRQQGLAPLDIKVAKSNTGGQLGKIKNRIKTKDKILFSRQLSTLINAGLPLVQSLHYVVSQTANPAFKVVITEIINDVEGGSAFAKSLAKHDRVFDDVFINLVAAGEASGTLDKALERIANQQEKDAEILSKVRGAMVYPLIVILVMLAVVSFMVITVLPQVKQLYDGLPGASLPLVTRVLLAFSEFTTRFWWLIAIFLIAGAFFGSRWARTGPGKEVIDRLKLHMWPIAPIFQKMYMARFARTGTTLVSTGVPLIQMLEITGKSMNNIHMERSLNHAIEKVKGGKALSDAIASDPNFLPLVPNMLKIGEQSGAIEGMLAKVADYYEKEVDNQIQAVSTIIEPVLMIMLGVIAFIIVAAVLLPIYSLAGKSIIR